MAYAEKYQSLIAQTYDDVYSVIRDPSGDVAFYVAQAAEAGGPVLEIGCGTGRILIPTARIGIECIGLDSSPEMLALLLEKNPPANLQLVNGQMSDFDLGEGRFQLITAPFRVLQHLLDIDSQLVALANVRQHLAPGGAFVFDVFDPKARDHGSIGGARGGWFRIHSPGLRDATLRQRTERLERSGPVGHVSL